jgi:hypothetical protein
MVTRIMQNIFANGLPTPGKIRNLGSALDNGGLEEYERRWEEPETICLTSIFGGTSGY